MARSHLWRWLDSWKNGPQRRRPIVRTKPRLRVEGLEDRCVPVADLAISALSGGPIDAPGQPVTIRFTVANHGDTPAAGTWTDAIYLSADNQLDANDILLGNLTHSGGLAVNASYDQTLTVPLPAIAAGLTHALVVTDAGDAVLESSGANNSSLVPLAVVPSSAVNQVQSLLTQLQTALGNLGAQQLFVSAVTTAANGAVNVTIAQDALAVPRFAGFPVDSFNLTVGVNGTSVTASGSARIKVSVGGVETPVTVTLSLNNGVLQIDGTAALGELRLGGDPAIVYLRNVTLTADVDVNLAAGTVAGGVSFRADNAVVFPAAAPAGQVPGGPVSATTLVGSVTSAGAVTATAATAQLLAGNALIVQATNAAFNFDPAHPEAAVLTLGSATATSPAFPGPSVAVSNLQVFRSGFTLSGITLTQPSLTLDSIATVQNLRIAANGLSYTPAGGFSVGGLTAAADRVTLFGGSATADGITFNFNIAQNSFTTTATSVTATAGPARVTANGGTLAVGPGATGSVFSTSQADLTVTVLGKDVFLRATDLRIERNGQATASSVTTNALAAIPKLPVAGVLPFQVTGVSVSGVNGGPIRLDSLDLRLTGNFDFSVFNGLPATPVVKIGDGPTATSSASTFDLTFRVDGGAVKLQQTGPVTLGFSNLAFGPLTLGATVTLGGIVNGLFDASTFGASFDVKNGTTALGLGTSLQVLGGLTTANGQTTFDLTGNFKVSFGLNAGAVQVTDANLRFRLNLTIDANGGFIGTPTLNLQGLSVGEVKLKFGDLLTFKSTAATFNFAAPANQPFATFGSLGVQFDNASGVLTGWGGTASNFGVGSDGGIYLLPNAGVTLQIPSTVKFGLPDWLPISLTKLGLIFHGGPQGDRALGSTGANLAGPVRLSDPLNFSILVSGGLTANNLFPVTATLTDLQINLPNLVRTLKGEANVPFPVENLSGINVAVNPFQLGKGFEVGGQLSFGTVTVNGKEVLYGRVKGGFKYQDLGADIDLILSQFGPVVATVSAPLAVPLGPSGAVLSGVTGGILFGSTVPNVTNPQDLVGPRTDPRFGNPLSLATNHPQGLTGFIADSVRAAVTRGVSTFQTAFTLVLAGRFTHVAAPGIVSANVTLAANINPTASAAAPAGVKLLGYGDVLLQGLPLGDAKVILDLTTPIAPKFAVAFQTPTPGSPLAFLLPANAAFVAALDTKGVAIGTAVGVRTFVDKVISGAAGQAQVLFNDALNRMADRIAADPTRPLAKFVLDTNGDGAVSAAEQAVVNNPAAFRTTFRSRLQQLLPLDFNVVQTAAGSTFDAKLERLARIGQAVLQELFDAVAAASKAAAQPQDFSGYLAGFTADVKNLFDQGSQAVLAVADIIKQAVADAAVAAADKFDPSLTITGKVQPTILGIPFGPSKNNVDVRLSKSGLFFTTDFSFAQFSANLLSGGLAGLLNVPLPAQDNLQVSVQLPFQNAFRDLAQGRLPTLDPVNGQWLLGLSGTFKLAGYDIGPVSGLIFPKNNPGLLLQKVQIVDVNGDGQRDAPLDPTKIQVADFATFNKLVANGGFLLDGILTAPKLITDPAGLARSIAGTIPDPQANPLGFLNSLLQLPQALGQLDAVAQAQFFLPNLVAGGQAGAAYLSGDVTGKLLSLQLASAKLSATKDKLQVSGTYAPLGVAATFGIDRGATNLPRVAAEVNLGTNQLAAAFANLGLPANLFSIPASANAKARFYSPGYDAASTDILKKSGGVELTAKLNIPTIVNNADFLFRFTPPASGLVPDFKAHASVDQLSIPGLSQAGLLALNDFDLDLTKAGSTTTLRLNGKARLFGNDLKADGTFTLNGSGLYGAFELKSLAGGAVPVLGQNLGFNLDGQVFLLVNTTGTSRNVTVNGRSVSIPAQSGKLHVDGSLKVSGFTLEGRFDVAAGAGGLQVTSDATLDLDSFGEFSTTGTLTIGSNGIVASLSLTDDGSGTSYFDVDGTFTLKLNSTGATANGIAPGASVSVTNGKVELTGLGSDYRLTGSMTIGFKNNSGTSNDYFYVSVPSSSPLHASLFSGAVDVVFYGELRSNGYVDLTATGDVNVATLGLELGVDLTIHVTRGTSGGFTFDAGATGSAKYLGFDLFDVSISLNKSGVMHVIASYDVPLLGRQSVDLTFDLNDL
jgi:CARDB